VTALSVGAIVCIASSNGGTTSQDLKTGFLVGATPRLQQIALLIGVLASAVIMGPILLQLNDNATVYVPAAQTAPNLKLNVANAKQERLKGPQGTVDKNNYFTVFKTDVTNGPAGKYLADQNGNAVYYVDPGINGTVQKRPDGTQVRKFQAPKAVLMSYIIKGILDRELPWGFVLIGAMISIVLELCGVGSLAFAVGVYLPIATSMPVFVGGLIRWLVDRKRRIELATAKLSEEELAADADRSPGVLCASGYIAGGAIAGILLAIMLGFPTLEKFDERLGRAAQNNPFFNGPAADALALIPFALLVVFLYLVGREKILSSADPDRAP
jgi:uncharacterized oligopeptide transporter (OPT) family protein